MKHKDGKQTRKGISGIVNSNKSDMATHHHVKYYVKTLMRKRKSSTMSQGSVLQVNRNSTAH